MPFLQSQNRLVPALALHIFERMSTAVHVDVDTSAPLFFTAAIAAIAALSKAFK
jgi:hypothetical protein